MQNKENPVLIVGAGPTGLSLANLLARMDIPFLLIEKNASPSPDSKSFAIQARTLEIFDQLGVAEKAVSKGNIDSTINIIVKDKVVWKASLKGFIPGKTNFPHLLILSQKETEKLLINALEDLGQKVLWQHELKHISIQEDKIVATIKEISGEEKKINVQYLIGCDGANSTVRKQAGFSFKGKTFSPTFYLADCEIDWGFSHGGIYFMIAPSYLSGVFSYSQQNLYRIFNFVNDAIDKEDIGELSDKALQKIVDDNPYLKMKVKSVEWTSVFKIHSRYTKNFRKGRVFLAGDAAHVHSPAGGQGMNTGIQDAYNLAWKINLVVKGITDGQFLNTYHEERFPIAQNLHNTTDRFFQLMIKKHWLLDLYRLYIFPLIFRLGTGIKSLRESLFIRGSQIAIKYRYSQLSKEGNVSGFKRNSPKPGDRMPFFKIKVNNIDSNSHRILKCTHFTIFIAVSVLGSEKANQLIEEIKSFSSSIKIESYFISRSFKGGSFFRSFGIKKDAIIIVRPDSHLGYRTSQLDFNEVKGYFHSILGKPI